MSLRYRPPLHLVVTGILMLALLALNSFAISPARQQRTEELAQLQTTYQNVQQQLQQTPSEAELRLLTQLQWTGADWTQATIDAMNTALARVQGLKATYALGTPGIVNLADEDYSVQRIDLEVSSLEDPAIFRFIGALRDALPGATAITALQIHQNESTPGLTAIVSLSLYRLVQP